MNPRWDQKNNNVVRNFWYLRTYAFWSLVLAFFAFSVVGWLWEVSLHLYGDGVFVNRGVMHGPWLPIYGGGVVLILVLLARWRSKPWLEVVLIVLLCGAVEYTTSAVLESTAGLRWWDYTGYFMNLNGKICGEGLTVFAIAGMISVYLLVPVLDSMWLRAKPKVLAVISIVLLICFSADIVYSAKVPNTGKGITDYSSYLEIEQ
ncbi:MAG: putative ABC transporter permease [Lachnospiraceae bacterium]|nr:putative ABC transporter permease [Lachnospiraceae bacterium]